MKAPIFVLALIVSTSAFSWSRYDTYDHTTNQEQQQKLLELQRRLDQTEFQRQLDAVDREHAAREAADEARREAEERAREAAEKAEQAAADVRNEMIRSSVRTRNNFYLAGLLLLMGAFVIYTTKRVNGGGSMDEDQKYGVVTMIASFLLILLVLMISEGWNPQMDYLENLLNSLHIELIQLQSEDYKPGEFLSSPYYHLIYWPSKYVVLVLLTVGAYGLTTYLGITGALRPWRSLLAK
jgi:hypothetical protein